MTSYEDPTAALDTLTGSPMASQFIATAFCGPTSVGALLHVYLFGMVTNQMLGYLGSSLYKQDSIWVKAILWLTFLSDLTVSSMNAFEIIHYVISQKRDAYDLFWVLKVDCVVVVVGGLAPFFVQGFLAHRASKLFIGTPRWRAVFLAAMAILIPAGLLAQLGSTIIELMWIKGTVARALPFTDRNMTATYCWIMAFVEVTISVTLILCLKKHIVGFNKSTDRTLKRIMRLGIKTGSLTAFLAIMPAILTVCFREDKINVELINRAFTSPLGSLYALSLLFTLASRSPVQPEGSTGNSFPAQWVPGTAYRQSYLAGPTDSRPAAEVIEFETGKVRPGSDGNSLRMEEAVGIDDDEQSVRNNS
ncbi:hypothetical protein T439DRAFT_109447 [Meredithblackwellia eburnea MCA 4105]